MTRKRLLSIIEKDGSNNKLSHAYDLLMLISIVVSLIPLATHSNARVFQYLDIVTCSIFIIDYFLRWMTADLRAKKHGRLAFLLYPVTPMAVVDLLAILPTLSLISPVFKVLRVSRVLRIIRIFKFLRYYEPLQIIKAVIIKEGKTLLTVGVFALFYILVCALVMFNVEEGPFFETFFDSIYWACCTLTTVGYGDIYPVSDIGRAFSMVSALVGIALIALPSGIITSGYMNELNKRRNQKD